MPPVAHQQTLTQGSTISPPLTILPLARQQSRGSISSWWSDSNPGLQGPTINLHAAAKPLMKIMYHRQALGLMKTNNSKQLSRETADIYSTYLLCKYVSTATKVTVLKGLQRKAGEESNACTVVDSGVLHCVPELLKSPDSAVRGQICWLLGRLAYYEATLPKILVLNPCTQLVSLLRDESLEVIVGAAYTLCQVSLWPDAAQAATDAKVLDYTATLLRSPEARIRQYTCFLVGQLATHTSTAPAVLELGLCRRLVSLLHDEKLKVIEGAAFALCEISKWPEGAQATVDTKVLDYTATLLRSPEAGIRQYTSILVGHLAMHTSTVPAALELGLCGQLVSLLRDENLEVIKGAAYALGEVSLWPEGAQAAVDAKVLDYTATLLGSSEHEIRRHTCFLVGQLAMHTFTVPAVLELGLCGQLVSLFRHENLEGIKGAACALCEVSRWPDGAQAAVDAKVLDYTATLLGSSEAGIRQDTCWLVGRLAMHASTAPAALELELCGQLVSLLHDENLKVIEGAAYALYKVSQWPDGAQAAVDAKVLDYPATLLGSSDAAVRVKTCFLVGQLATHTSTAPAALELGLCRQLVSLLRDKNLEVIEGAAYALSKISLWPDGAQAATDAKVLDHVAELLQSQNVWTLRRTCELVGHLVSHESTALPSLAATPWMWLLPSLHSDTDFVRTAAAFALAKTSQQPDGVAALADTGILDDLETLNQSSEDGTQVYASRIRKNVARYKARRRPKESSSVALSQRTLYDHTTT